MTTRKIRTDQPSSGKPLLLFIPSSVNDGFVDTDWTTIVEAPEFSIPSNGDNAVLDPEDLDRELRPGEIYFETPLTVTNTSETSQWVELQIVLEGESGQAIPVTPQITVPGKESVYLQIQGLRLLKTDLGNDEPGGLLQIRCQTSDTVTVIGSAVELEASDHAPDTEDL